MKPQEAIEILQEEHDYAQQLSYVNAALELAISALEKQIPKKPIEKETDNLWTGMSTRTVSCPKCKKQIVNVWNRADYKPKFCHYCGQALDWGEKE